MLDADKFKPFNDMYGHPSGDACLRLVSTAICGQLRRAGDLAARFGGDEFAAILPGADEEGAVLIAERILQAIRSVGVLHPASSSGVVTASAGVAAIVPSLSQFEPHHLLQLADAALYAAKDKGGNQVCSVIQAASQENLIFDRIEKEHSIGASEPDGNWAPRMPIGMDFVSILRGIPFGVLVTDSTQPDHPIVFANAGFSKMTGYSLKEAAGRNSRFLQGPDTDPRTVIELAEAVRHGVPIQRELLNYRKDGQTFWNGLYMQPLSDRHGALVGFVGLLIDQTARRRAEEGQRDSEAKLSAIVENLPGYLFQRVMTAEGSLRFTYFSPSYWRLLGIEVAPPLATYDPFVDIYLADVEMVRSEIARSAASMSVCTIEFRAMRTDGTLLWLRTQSTPCARADGSVAWDGVGIDITSEMASKEQLAYLAYHDPLTGLCNRIQFVRTLTGMCAPNLAEARHIAAFSIDLDSFQSINEKYGSSVGDAVLRCVSERLADFAGASGIAARIGGDEFGIATTEVPPGAPLADKAARLCRILQSPMHIGEYEISIQVCLGAAAYAFEDIGPVATGDAAENLVKRSNFALAQAKRAGSGVFRLYSKELDHRERNRLVLRDSMQRGMDRHQFVLHYHPIVDLATGEIIGAEALVRWAHPTLGMQRPDLFIPEAESSGLIVPLGAWVIRTALLEMRDWPEQRERSRRIAINVSGIQLLDPGFVAMLDRILAETGADPKLIDLELTETILIGASALSVLNALKERGFQLAVDDFGTGYSSFRYLQSLPVGKVKIDQSFVRHMVIDSSDASIVRAIVAVAKSLELEVIAEGIETASQRDFLHNEGCPIGQGYLFSLPLAAEDFRWLLASRATLPLGEAYVPVNDGVSDLARAPPESSDSGPQLAEEMT